MFYYFFLMKIFTDHLLDKKKIFGILATIISALLIPASILLTIFTKAYFFDMWLLFAIFIGISFMLILIGITFNIKEYNTQKKIML